MISEKTGLGLDAIVQQTEKAKAQGELELALHRMTLEKQRLAAEVESQAAQRGLDQAVAERGRAKAEAELSLAEAKSKAAAVIAERDVNDRRARRASRSAFSKTSSGIDTAVFIPGV